jgi:hypothetical protein
MAKTDSTEFPEDPEMGQLHGRWLYDGDDWVLQAGEVPKIGDYPPLSQGDLSKLLVNSMRFAFLRFTPAQRLKCIEGVLKGYCHHCGTEGLPCHCENDL